MDKLLDIIAKLRHLNKWDGSPGSSAERKSPWQGTGLQILP